MKMAAAIIIIGIVIAGAGYLYYEFTRTTIKAVPVPSPNPSTATSTITPASPLELSQRLVVETEELIQTGIVTATSTEGGKKILFLRSPNNVAKYFFQTGSEDSVVAYHFYYDQSQTLRAAIIKAGAVNGSKLHHVIYFDESGTNRISEEQLYETGITYSWPQIWPEKNLIREPQTNFKP